jgi:hypothetical protein
MSKLKFELFESFESFENENEQVVVHSAQGVSGSNKKPYTYLDEFSALQKNEKKLVEYASDLIEHVYAKTICDKFDALKNSNVDNTYYIKNKYISSGNLLTINKNNVATYTSDVPGSKCLNIKKWAENTNNLSLNSGSFTYPTNNFTENSLNDFYTNITNNYGMNSSIDISFIDTLTAYSNSMMDDLSNNYTSSNQASTYINNIDRYNANIELRQKLDYAMTELYNGDQSIAMYQKKSLDSVVYANILWTILATSLIYYVFVII